MSGEVVGSHDNKPPRIVDVKRETLLAILVYPDGRVHFSSSQPEEWVVETLQRITDAQRARVFGTSTDGDVDGRY